MGTQEFKASALQTSHHAADKTAAKAVVIVRLRGSKAAELWLGDARPAGPLRVRRRAAVASEIARIVRIAHQPAALICERKAQRVKYCSTQANNAYISTPSNA